MEQKQTQQEMHQQSSKAKIILDVLQSNLELLEEQTFSHLSNVTNSLKDLIRSYTRSIYASTSEKLESHYKASDCQQITMERSQLIQNPLNPKCSVKEEMTNPKIFEIINKQMIPYTDYLSKLEDKISSLLFKKHFLNESVNHIQKNIKSQISKEEQEKGKQNFDIVCDYRLRQQENIADTHSLYDINLCKYLTLKTFQKSSRDSSKISLKYFQDFKAILQQKHQSQITNDSQKQNLIVAGIGGGPGSDLTGLMATIIDVLHNDQVLAQQQHDMQKLVIIPRVFDFQPENWSNANKANINLAFKEIKQKFYDTKEKEQQIEIQDVDWKFIDFRQPESLGVFNGPDGEVPEIVTFCWTLNETLVRPDFWEKLINVVLKNSLIFIVDGQRNALDELLEALHLDEIGRKHHYYQFENPRRLVIFPTNQIN